MNIMVSSFFLIVLMMRRWYLWTCILLPGLNDCGTIFIWQDCIEPPENPAGGRERGKFNDLGELFCHLKLFVEENHINLIRRLIGIHFKLQTFLFKKIILTSSLVGKNRYWKCGYAEVLYMDCHLFLKMICYSGKASKMEVPQDKQRRKTREMTIWQED